MRHSDVIRLIEGVAPLSFAASWDNSGVQVAGAKDDVLRLAVALDPTLDTIGRALDWGADFILTHHPLTLSPRLPNRRDDFHEIIRRLMAAGTWLYAAHTSLDVQADGPVGWLARALGLTRLRPLECETPETALEVRFEVPASEREARRAFFERLSGENGVLQLKYHPESEEFLLACWTGAWTGLRSALERELKSKFSPFARELASPKREIGFGLIGTLAEPMAWPRFADTVMDLIPRDHAHVIGTPPKAVRSVAYCTGSGASLIRRAFSRNADVYVTGDVKYHQAQEAESQGCVIDVGHFSLEEKMMQVFAEDLGRTLDGRAETAFFSGKEPFGLLRRPERQETL